MITADVPQASILGPLFSLIYVNDLHQNLTSVAILFTDYTSLFSLVSNSDISASDMNNDLAKIQDWACK